MKSSKIYNYNYTDAINRMYECKDIAYEGSRNITFQVTDDCCCACSYCYQTNKGHKNMSKQTAKEIVDLLFRMYDQNIDKAYISKKTSGVVLEFIGGEPLMNIDIIDYTCTYFIDKCLELNHPWRYTWRASMISNGKYYFTDKVQNFLKKFKGYINIDITLDGPKEIHDSCRKYHNGQGNFDDAYKAFKDIRNKNGDTGTKVTIAPENLHNLNNIVDFFVNEGITRINSNCIYEHDWTIEEGKQFYKELKIMADKLIENPNITCSLFEYNFLGTPKKEDDLQNWCGGTGLMLAFDPDGNAFPCLRYMESSLDGKREPIIIGNSKAIYTDEYAPLLEKLRAVNRRTKCTDECFYCPIATGCADCAAYNYQESGSLNFKTMHICNMHKARVLANTYYWNKIGKKFDLNLAKEECLKFIDEDEYNLLIKLRKDVE